MDKDKSLSTRGTSTRTRMRSQERRAQLLDVAAALVADQGVGAVTMERVASEAGVSKPIVYDHFENSTALVAALVGREEARLDAVVTERLTGTTTMREAMRAVTAPFF